MDDLHRRLSVAVFLLLWSVAVVPGLWSLRSLAWPYDPDGFRDVGAAQALLDGRIGDPLYKGEVAWYPPIVPATISLTALVTDLPAHQAYVATGLWLNSLIPIAFLVCARRLLGTWPALAATCAFLFLPGRPPAWASATYSPWPFPALVAQMPFYLGVWMWVRTLERWTLARLLGAGVVLGVTFLAHTGVGLVLAGIMLVTTCAEHFALDASHRRAVWTVVVPFATALLMVSPLLAPIAVHYGFHTVNRDPATWVYEDAYPSVIAAGALRPSAIIQLLIVGTGVMWIRRHRQRRTWFVLMSWAGFGIVGLTYSVWAEQMPQLPALVSAYHFLFVLRALKWLLFGCGVIAITTAVWDRTRSQVGVSREIAYATIILLVSAALYPRYLGREAFVLGPRESLEAVTTEEELSYAWIRANTNPTAVFLSSDTDALRVVGVAGRYVVCVERFFSNPYVRHEVRASHRDDMLTALLNGDRTAFARLRDSYDVSHVLARGDEVPVMRDRNAGLLTQVFSAGSIAIFEVATSGDSSRR